MKLHVEDYTKLRKLPSNVVKALYSINDCKTATLGGHIYECNDCGEIKIA